MLKYHTYGKTGLAIIETIWNKNREYHEDNSEYFKSNNRANLFLKRKSVLESLEDLRVIVVEDENVQIGFCIASYEYERGTVESLYVEEKYRRQGIRTRLIKDQLKWFEEKECKRISVSTVYGNTVAIAFYKKFDFLPRVIVLEKR